MVHPPRQMIDEITGLRALAVLSVIVFHFNPGLLPGGYLGVDVFFVISGFVITRSLMASREQALGPYLLEFYSRRLKRLMPALALVVGVGAVLTALFDPTPKITLLTGLTAMFGLSNMYLVRAAQDYFASSTDFNTFTHTWSLGVEEQYYFVYPVMFFFFLGAVRRGRHAGVIVALSVLGLASLALFQWLYATRPLFAFYLMPARFWELAAGCLIALGLSGRSIAPRTGAAIALGSLVVLGLCLAGSEDIARLSTPPAVVATCGLILFAHHSRPLRALLTNPVALWIGLASYSLYLWHWPVLAISRWTVGISLATAVPQLLLMFAMAALSYHLIETPLRQARWVGGRAGTVLGGLGISVVAAMFVAVVWKPLDGRLFLGTRVHAGQITESPWLAQHEPTATAARAFADSCNITPHHLTGPRYAPKPNVDGAFLDRCLRTDATSPRLLLVGDSFASRSVEHLAVMAKDMGRAFGVLFGYGCPFPLPKARIQGAALGACEEVNEDWLYRSVIDHVHPGDVVVLRLYLMKDQYLAYAGHALPRVDAYDAVLGRFGADIAARGGRLMVIGANATLSPAEMPSLEPQWYNAALFAGDFGPDNTRETKLFHALDAHLVQRFAQDRNVNYLSIAGWFCTENERCRLRDGSEVFYIDEVHLSPLAYDRFREVLRAHLQVASTSSADATRGAATR